MHLTRGALGRFSLLALTQEFVGRELGTNGGAFNWKRRHMNQSELEHVGSALASAFEIVMSEIESDIVRRDPETILASEPSDAEAEIAAKGWVEEAMTETVRRQQIVEAAMRRRRGLQ